MKKQPIIDYSNDNETLHSKSSSNNDNESSTKESSKMNFSKFSSFRQKQNKSPTKDGSAGGTLNSSPAPPIVLRSNVHSSPRLGKESRVKSYYERTFDAPLLPHRPAPEVRDIAYRASLIIPSIHEPEKVIASVYPTLDSEVYDISCQIPALSTFHRPDEPAGNDLSVQPPQKPPRASSATPMPGVNHSTVPETPPLHDSTHL